MKINWGDGRIFISEGASHRVWQDPHYNVIKEEIVSKDGTEITYSVTHPIIESKEFKTEQELLEELKKLYPD